MPDRWKKAGKRICGPFVGVFDAVQADLEFVRKIFDLKRAFLAIYRYLVDWRVSRDDRIEACRPKRVMTYPRRLLSQDGLPFLFSALATYN